MPIRYLLLRQNCHQIASTSDSIVIHATPFPKTTASLPTFTLGPAASLTHPQPDTKPTFSISPPSPSFVHLCYSRGIIDNTLIHRIPPFPSISPKISRGNTGDTVSSVTPLYKVLDLTFTPEDSSRFTDRASHGTRVNSHTPTDESSIKQITRTLPLSPRPGLRPQYRQNARRPRRWPA